VLDVDLGGVLNLARVAVPPYCAGRSRARAGSSRSPRLRRPGAADVGGLLRREGRVTGLIRALAVELGAPV